MTDRGLRKTSGPLRVEVVDNAVATVFTYDRTTGKIAGCIYDNDRNRVNLSMRTSGVGGDRVTNDDPEILPDKTNPLLRLQGTSVYLGHLMGHYGHFITETLSAFWLLKDIKPSYFVFHPFLFGGNLLPFMEYFMEAFAIDIEKIVVIKEACSFERLIVPERTFHLNAHVHERYRDISKHILDFYSSSSKVRTRKIFLSRSFLPNDIRGANNSNELDALMISLGFEIIHPQTLTTEEQLKIYGSTLVMAGLSGSALHNCIFLEPRCAIIEIGDARSSWKSLPTQVLCSLASEIKALYVPFSAVDDVKSEKTKNFDLVQLEKALRSKLSCLSVLGMN